MRRTSDVKDCNFPFADDRVPFILVYNFSDYESVVAQHKEMHGFERGFDHASTRNRKIDLLQRAQKLTRDGRPQAGAEPMVLAAWPGAKRTDVFHVDDLDQALAAFG